MSVFATIAPRLARAHAERRIELEQEAIHERHRRTMLLRAERLMAHRELQLIRAEATGRRRYIAVRQRKLEAARTELAKWQT